MHWVLDMAFREDLSRVRVGHGAHNFSLLRRLALNLLRQDHTARCGIKDRRLSATATCEFLCSPEIAPDDRFGWCWLPTGPQESTM